MEMNLENYARMLNELKVLNAQDRVFSRGVVSVIGDNEAAVTSNATVLIIHLYYLLYREQYPRRQEDDSLLISVSGLDRLINTASWFIEKLTS